MNASKFHIVYLIFCLLLVSGNILSAQDSKNEALFDSAVLYVYDQPQKAIKIGEILLKNYDKQPEKQVQVLLVLSNAYSSLRNYEKSLELSLEAKKLSVKIKKPDLQYQVLNKIAVQYHLLGVNDKALQVLDESDKLLESIPDKDSLQFVVGNNYAIRGFIYRDQLSCDIAIEYLNKAYKAFSTREETVASLANRSVVTYNKGNCFVTMNQLDSAKINYIMSEDLASRAAANSLQAFSLKGLAEVYTLESKFKESNQLLNNAYDLSKNVGDLVLNRGIYKGMADNYLALKDWENFYLYDEKFKKTIVQIKENERTTIQTLLDGYLMEKTKEKKKVQMNYGIAFLVASVVLIALVFWTIKSERSFRKSISELKTKIKS